MNGILVQTLSSNVAGTPPEGFVHWEHHRTIPLDICPDCDFLWGPSENIPRYFICMS